MVTGVYRKFVIQGLRSLRSLLLTFTASSHAIRRRPFDSPSRLDLGDRVGKGGMRGIRGRRRDRGRAPGRHRDGVEPGTKTYSRLLRRLSYSYFVDVILGAAPFGSAFSRSSDRLLREPAPPALREHLRHRDGVGRDAGSLRARLGPVLIPNPSALVGLRRDGGRKGKGGELVEGDSFDMRIR